MYTIKHIVLLAATVISCNAFAQSATTGEANDSKVNRVENKANRDKNELRQEIWKKASPEQRERMKQEFRAKHPERAERFAERDKRHEEMKAFHEKMKAATPEQREKMKKDWMAQHPEFEQRMRAHRGPMGSSHEGMDRGPEPMNKEFRAPPDRGANRADRDKRHEEMTAFHEKMKTATPEQREQMKKDWMAQHPEFEQRMRDHRGPISSASEDLKKEGPVPAK